MGTSTRGGDRRPHFAANIGDPHGCDFMGAPIQLEPAKTGQAEPRTTSVVEVGQVQIHHCRFGAVENPIFYPSQTTASDQERRGRIGGSEPPGSHQTSGNPRVSETSGESRKSEESSKGSQVQNLSSR